MDDFNNLKTMNYRQLKSIKKFIDIFNKELSHCSTFNLKNNLKTLKIYTIKKIVDKDDITYGTYDTKNNIIYLSKLKYIFHELLHVSSTNVKENFIYSGFRCIDLDKNISICRSINEGYTNLLSIGYFKNFVNLENCYILETHFIKMVEIIIEKYIMEKLYFNSDFDGFIEEFLKYNSYDLIKKFIFDMEKLNENNVSVLKSINSFLINSYINKLKIEYDGKLIDFNLLEKKLLNFINELGYIKIYDKNHYINNLQYIDIDNIEYNLKILKNNLVLSKKSTL